MAVVSAVLYSACSAPSQSSCDGRPHGHQRCTDLLTNPNGDLAPTLETFCKGDDGVFSTSLCNHTGSLGGCECDTCENGKGITWLFVDPDAGFTTAADVMSLCGDAGRAYQSP